MKFELLVSTSLGNSQVPEIVKRATDGLHVFYLYAFNAFITSMQKPYRISNFNIYEKDFIYVCSASVCAYKL